MSAAGEGWTEPILNSIESYIVHHIKKQTFPAGLKSAYICNIILRKMLKYLRRKESVLL